MEYLKESIEKLREENNLEKQEISLYLDQLVQGQDHKSGSLVCTPESNYLTELCKYEQLINHKLTEIKCELKKFVYINKHPVYKPTRRKSDVDSIDIETLKQNSFRLISKLEEYKNKDENRLYNAEANPINFINNSFSSEVQYPYVAESTIEKLSDHTKWMLKDLSTSSNSTLLPVKTEDMSTADNVLSSGCFPKIYEKSPSVNRIRDGFIMNSTDTSINTSAYSSNFENKFSECVNTIQDNQSAEILKEDSEQMTEPLNSASNNEYKPISNELIDSFLESTLDHLKVPSLNNCKSDNGNSLIDFQIDKTPTYLEFINENLEKDNLFSSESCFKNHIKIEEVNSSENCSSVLESNIEVSTLIDLGEDHKLVDSEYNDSKMPEISNMYLDSAVSTFTNEVENTALGGNSNDGKKLNNIEDNDCNFNAKVNIDILKDLERDSLNFETEQCEQLLKFSKDYKEDPISKYEYSRDALIFKNDLTEGNKNLEDNEKLRDPQEFQSVSIPENLKDCNLVANIGIPVYSASEKIMKLGLEDRFTKFEKTRHRASFPDLRLQPSVTDNEKMNQILHQGAKFEIMDKEIPGLYTTCVFSHVESPFEFYVHLDDEESQLIDCLNDLITQHYRKTTTPYKSKFEAFERLGKFCCAYVKDDKTYYRAEVMDWLFDKDTKIVLVQLVDYGNITLVHYKHLRELNKDFSALPKLAVKCYLPMLYPPGSTKGHLLNDWPLTTVEALRDIGGLCNSTTKVLYKIFYVHKEGEFHGVDMYEEGNDELSSIGQLLIDLGHAVQIVLPSDDPMGVVSDDKDIERFEECENINEVVLGYDPKDEGRICKFTRRDGTCFKGKNCKLEHLQFLRGGYTTDHILTFCSAVNEIVLPQMAESFSLRFTVFLEASHYYINLMQYVDSLVNLEKIMNDKLNCSTYQQYKIMPAYGEIVLVKHWCKRWMRGKVRHHSYDDEGNCSGVQIFMVDYGDIVDVSLKDIRHIKPEFLVVPFQAVECILYNYKARNDVDIKDVDKFFYDNMFFREFVGQVMGRSNILLLKVHHKNRDVGQILTEHGFLTEVCTQIFPSDQSVVIPG